ncbi:MAG: LTA synthase family protein [Woeseiaceae bacterium]|nr:LTA synthase family protein [Woeseiaceae bacterium]
MEVGLIWLVSGLLTPSLEKLLRPTPRLTARPMAAWSLHVGLWTLLYAVLLLLTQRALFAAAAGLVIQLSVVLVSNAKYKALQEPFLFSDFGLFSQALRHPRLYLPFMGLRSGVIVAVAILLALYVAVILETPLTTSVGWAQLVAIVALGLILAALLVGLGTRLCPKPSLLPERDLNDFGLAASLWLYWRHESREALADTPISRLPSSVSLPGGGQLSDIVVVQSESFFDARRLWPDIRPELLSEFDSTAGAAILHGRLNVPAWGANTMRTEFAFLTGIAPDDLGIHRFNPYRRFARRPLPSIVSLLKNLGYRTVCIHPHPMSFFSRDKVYPLLGFDEFIDLAHFEHAETCGPYICDAAVTEMVQRILATSSGPLFVFAITMENHGPLHLEKASPEDERRLFRTPPPATFSDLSVYLRHLSNADRMLADVTELLDERVRPALLCWFGDHVPSMPEVYAHTGYDDESTDYLIWETGQPARGKRRDLSVEQLPAVLLGIAGLHQLSQPADS